MWILRKEKIGDSSAGVSSSWGINGGLRENIIDAGREPIPSPRGFEPPTGDKSDGGDGVSGEGVCHLGGVSMGVTLREDRLLSFPEPLFFGPPQVDINERTRRRTQGRVSNAVLPKACDPAGGDQLFTYHASDP